MGIVILKQKTFRLDITKVGEQVQQFFELPTDMQGLTHIQIRTSPLDTFGFYRGIINIRVSGYELIGDEAVRDYIQNRRPLVADISKPLPISATDRQMTVVARDKENPTTTFTPYTVEVILFYTTTK